MANCPLPGASAKAVADQAGVVQKPPLVLHGRSTARAAAAGAARDVAPLDSGEAIADLGAQSTSERLVPGALLRVGNDVGLQLGELLERAEVPIDASDDGVLLHALRRAQEAVQILPVVLAAAELGEEARGVEGTAHL